MTQLRHYDQLAARYGTRPSTMIGLNDPYLAYCLDEACMLATVLHQDKPRTAGSRPRERLTVDGHMPLITGTFHRVTP